MADEELVGKIRRASRSDDWEFIRESFLDEGYEQKDILEAFNVVNSDKNRSVSGQNETRRKVRRQCPPQYLPPSAPYRFVALSETIEMPTKEESGPLMTPLADGICGELTLAWVAETPILIGQSEKAEQDPVRQPGKDEQDPVGQSGKDEQYPVTPMELIPGQWTIPGSSLRGMIRSAMECVANARLYRVNGHHRYGVRDFVHPAFDKKGQYPVSDVQKVQAGWLYREDTQDPNLSGYKLLPCQWAQVMVEDLDAKAWNWVQEGLEKKYQKVGMKKDERIDFKQIRHFSEASPRLGKDVWKIDQNGSKTGVLVFSDKVPMSGHKKKDEKALSDSWKKKWEESRICLSFSGF